MYYTYIHTYLGLIRTQHIHVRMYIHTYVCNYVYIRINKKYVLIPEVNILGRKNTKRTQRRGRNVWAWVG